MKRPNWLRPQIGQGHPGGRDRLRPDREERKESPRTRRLSREDDNRKDRSAGTPAAGRNPQGTRSTFRQEMRAARLRQEERRQEEEKRRAEREKVRQEAQAYIYGRTEEAERKALEDRAAGRETFRARQEQKAEALEKKDRRSLFRKRKKAPAGTEAGKPGKKGKRRPRRRLNWARVLLLLGSAALLIASYVTLHQPWLAFGRLEVAGNTAVTLDEVKEMGDAAEPLNIFNLNRKKLLDSLRSDYRVEKAELALGWPNILKVVITDRQPALYVAMEGTRYANLDPTGHIIGLADGITGGDAPFVSGWHIAQGELGGVTEDEEIQGILGFLGKLDPDLKERIMEIHVDDQKSLKIYLHNGIPVILGTYENADSKLKTFKAICQELEAKKIKAQYIDLTYEKPYIKL